MVKYVVIGLSIFYLIKTRIGIQKLKKYIHLFVFGASLFMLFIGCVNMQGARMGKNDIECPGYVTNIKSGYRYAAKSFRKEYSYTVHYTFKDGKEYTKEVTGQFDKPDKNLKKVWVSPDQKVVGTDSYKSKVKNSYYNFVIALVLFIISIPLRIRFKKKYPRPTKDDLENFVIWGTIVGVVTLFGMVLLSYDFYKIVTGQKNLDYLELDLGLVCCIGFICSVIAIIRSKIKIKKRCY